MLPRLAAGLGYRDEIAADLLRTPRSVDFVEVVAESCYVKPAARREAHAVAEIWPVIPHGVKLSLGAAEGIEKDRAKALGSLAKDLRAPFISEHVAFVRSGSREIGHLTGLPFTRTAIGVIARNVALARKQSPDIPLLPEKIAWTSSWPDNEMAEPDFYQEIAAQTGCPLLLDVGNLYANALNSGQNPVEFAAKFPLERVAMIHLAGGVFEDDFYFDDHAHAVTNDVFSLLQSILAKTGPVPILIERDAFFPPFVELAAEVALCRTLLRQTQTPGKTVAPISPQGHVDAPADRVQALEQGQNLVAQLLVDPRIPEQSAFEARAIQRSRAILQRKRVDEALPLLSFLAPHKAEVTRIAEEVVTEMPRPAKLAGISDAFAIAQRASRIPALRFAAERDLLGLQTRFVHDPETNMVRPRNAPYFGIHPLSNGKKALISARGIEPTGFHNGFQHG
ncbi:MAG TPA: DUF692 domain-containing protein, partial [Polyangium sp.]|nr:DUF692 domain-containing protein [Polyangium sp.]